MLEFLFTSFVDEIGVELISKPELCGLRGAVAKTRYPNGGRAKVYVGRTFVRWKIRSVKGL